MEERETKKVATQQNRLWEDLPRDIIVSILLRVSTNDLIVGAPLCCRSWYDASKDPCLWIYVDLLYFAAYNGKLNDPTQLTEFVIARSQGSLANIRFPLTAGFEHLLLVAESCPNLESFSLVEGEETEVEILCTAVAKFKQLEIIEVNTFYFSSDISTLELINQNCPNFTTMILHGHVSETTAFNISTTLPRLKTLHVLDAISGDDVLVILNGCVELEILSVYTWVPSDDDEMILDVASKRLKEFTWQYQPYVSPENSESESEMDDSASEMSDCDSGVVV